MRCFQKLSKHHLTHETPQCYTASKSIIGFERIANILLKAGTIAFRARNNGPDSGGGEGTRGTTTHSHTLPRVLQDVR